MNTPRTENEYLQARVSQKDKTLTDLGAIEILTGKDMGLAKGGNTMKEVKKYLKALGPGQP